MKTTSQKSSMGQWDSAHIVVPVASREIADSFIYADDFSTAKAMAQYLHQLNQSNDLYICYVLFMKYFKA